MSPTSQSKRNPRSSQFHPRTLKKRNHTRVMEPLHRQLLLCQKERQKTLTSTRLSPHQQMDETKPKHIPSNPTSHRPSEGLHTIYKGRRQMGLQQHRNK